jgi:hypothetical protein
MVRPEIAVMLGDRLEELVGGGEGDDDDDGGVAWTENALRLMTILVAQPSLKSIPSGLRQRRLMKYVMRVGVSSWAVKLLYALAVRQERRGGEVLSDGGEAAKQGFMQDIAQLEQDFVKFLVETHMKNQSSESLTNIYELLSVLPPCAVAYFRESLRPVLGALLQEAWGIALSLSGMSATFDETKTKFTLRTMSDSSEPDQLRVLVIFSAIVTLLSDGELQKAAHREVWSIKRNCPPPPSGFSVPGEGEESAVACSSLFELLLRPLMCSYDWNVKNLVAECLFKVVGEDAKEFVSLVGIGNAAGFLVAKGLASLPNEP